jgi:TetR/AcrR family fatty acid metabolism transcriptional regulator
MSKKNAILSAATRLFSQKGYDGAAMAELSRMTGAAGGTIFHHFKNKEALFVSALRNIEETIIFEFETHFNQQQYKTGLAMVEGAITFYLQLADTMKDQFLLLHRHFPYKMAETNPVCRRYLTSIFDCLLDIFERGISIGQQDGSVGNLPTRHTAMILFSMVDGTVFLHTHHLYDADALYSTLMHSCRRLLKNQTETFI